MSIIIVFSKGFNITRSHDAWLHLLDYVLTRPFAFSRPPEVARRRKILRSTFLLTSNSQSAASGMRAYSARKSMRFADVVCFALVFPFVVVKLIQTGKPSTLLQHALSPGKG